MKFNNVLAFLLTLIAIITIVVGAAIKFSGVLVYKKDCTGYSLILFTDANKVDAVVGKGELIRLQAVNAGNFGDKYDVSLIGPDWAIIKPASFALRSDEVKTLFLYISPDVGAEGKYNLDVTVKSQCASQTESIEVGVIKEGI
jgi:hypothetical protein